MLGSEQNVCLAYEQNIKSLFGCFTQARNFVDRLIRTYGQTECLLVNGLFLLLHSVLPDIMISSVPNSVMNLTIFCRPWGCLQSLIHRVFGCFRVSPEFDIQGVWVFQGVSRV